MLTLRIQILLSSVLKLSDASGLNKKSTNNQSSLAIDSIPEEELLLVPSELKSLYHSFWTNMQYLACPVNLLSIKKPDASLKEDDAGPGETSFSKLVTTSKYSTVNSFFDSYTPLLDYFKANPIDTNDEVIKRFPKYIKDPQLFVFQISEPYFRKSVLLQLKLAFQVITNLEFDKLNKLNNKEGFLSNSSFSD